MFDGVAHGFDGTADLEYLGRLLFGVGSHRVSHLADPVRGLVRLVGRDIDLMQDGFEARDESVDRIRQMADLVVVVRGQPPAQVAVVQMIDLACDVFQTQAQVAPKQGLRHHGDDAQREHRQQHDPEDPAHAAFDLLSGKDFGRLVGTGQRVQFLHHRREVHAVHDVRDL